MAERPAERCSRTGDPHLESARARGCRTVPATNRVLEKMRCLEFRVRADKIVEQRHYFDMATLMRQLDPMPGGG